MLQTRLSILLPLILHGQESRKAVNLPWPPWAGPHSFLMCCFTGRLSRESSPTLSLLCVLHAHLGYCWAVGLLSCMAVFLTRLSPFLTAGLLPIRFRTQDKSPEKCLNSVLHSEYYLAFFPWVVSLHCEAHLDGSFLIHTFLYSMKLVASFFFLVIVRPPTFCVEAHVIYIYNSLPILVEVIHRSLAPLITCKIQLFAPCHSL